MWQLRTFSNIQLPCSLAVISLGMENNESIKNQETKKKKDRKSFLINQILMANLIQFLKTIPFTLKRSKRCYFQKKTEIEATLID